MGNSEGLFGLDFIPLPERCEQCWKMSGPCYITNKQSKANDPPIHPPILSVTHAARPVHLLCSRRRSKFRGRDGWHRGPGLADVDKEERETGRPGAPHVLPRCRVFNKLEVRGGRTVSGSVGALPQRSLADRLCHILSHSLTAVHTLSSALYLLW